MYRYLMIALFLVLAAPSIASMFAMPEIPFRTYKSTDEKIEYDVEPSDRQGAGASHIVIRVEGTKVWEGDLPFTFWEASVTKDGLLVGYCYGNGYFPIRQANDEKKFPEAIIAASVDVNGEVLKQEKFPRNPVPYTDTIPQTTVEGFEFDATNNRLLVYVNDEDLNRMSDSIWIVPLNSDSDVKVVRPAEIAGDGEKFRSAKKVAIAGTPLILCANWNGYGLGRASMIRWILVDADGRKWWSLDDQTGDSHKEGEAALVPSGFTIRLNGSNDIATFSVSNIQGDWKVAETGRTAAGLPLQTPVPSDSVQRMIPGPDSSKFPQKHFPVAEKITLERTMEQSSPFATFVSPDSFAIDESGNIAIMRDTGGPIPTFVLLTPNGDVKTEIKMPQFNPTRNGVGAKVYYAGTNQFLFFARDESQGKGKQIASHPWIVNTTTSELRKLPIDVWGSNNIDSFHTGKFVVSDWKDADINKGSQIRVIDLQGNVSWTIDSMPLSKNNIFSPQDVTFNSEGNVAVLYHFPPSIITYGAKGEVLKTILLEEALGVKPRYPADLYAGKHASLFVSDPAGAKPLAQLDADGKLLAEIHPEAHFFETDFAGYLWFADGYTIKRLNDGGEVDKVLGTPPSDEELGEVKAMAISRAGQVYLMAKRTQAIHVFAPDGKQVTIIHPNPDDLSSPVDNLASYKISPLDSGSVILFHINVRNGITAAEYAKDGNRVRTISLPPSLNGPNPAVQPATGRIWMGQYKKLQLLDENGVVLKDIERYADKQWIDRIWKMEVNEDGALLVRGESTNLREERWITALFDKDGNAINCVITPQEFAMFFNSSFANQFYIKSDSVGVYAFNLKHEPMWRFAIPNDEEAEGPRFQNFTAIVGDQLWNFDSQKTIWKHSLSEM